mgnify:FL=1
MVVDFKSLKKNSRVWVFQSVDYLDNLVVEEIKKKLSLFLNEWKSHQRDFKSSFEIRYNAFIIVAADESNLVSGCSIDSLINFIKDLQSSYELQLLDKLHVKYIENGKIITQHLDQFKIHCQSLGKKDNLIVFNNLVKNINELENNWQVDIRNSWHNRYIK